MRHLFLSLFFIFSTTKLLAGQTADQSDLYLQGTWGVLNTGGSQIGMGGGYVFAEGFGLGLVYENSANAFFVAPEIRWFLEPFESAISMGVQSLSENSTAKYHPMVTLLGEYLFSITPGLAIKVGVKWLLPIDNRSSVFTGVGFRLLF